MKKKIFEAALAGIDDKYILEASEVELGRLFGKSTRAGKPLKYAFIAAAVCVMALAASLSGMWLGVTPSEVTNPPQSTAPGQPPVIPQGYKLSALTFISNGDGTSTVEGLVDAESGEKIVLRDEDVDKAYGYESEKADLPFPHNSITVIVSGSKEIVSVSPYENAKSVVNLVIPDGVEHIPDHAFSKFVNLRSVVLPSSLKSIGKQAFSGCQSLQSITLPDKLSEIGAMAFYGCDIDGFCIPYSVQSIGENAFINLQKNATVCCIAPTQPKGWDEDWSDGTEDVLWSSYYVAAESKSVNTALITGMGLKYVKVSERNPHFRDIYGVLFNKDASELLLYPPRYTSFESRYTVPQSVRIIAPLAFCDTVHLESLIIHGEVEIIGEYAVSNPRNLLTVMVEADSRPVGWDENWYESRSVSVVWAYERR